MPFARRKAILALMFAALMAGATLAIPPAVAQDPPKDNGPGQGKANPKAGKKKAVRRRPKANGPVGVIVPFPLGGALIIRHTPETHDEIQALLNMLRYE